MRSDSDELRKFMI